MMALFAQIADVAVGVAARQVVFSTLVLAVVFLPARLLRRRAPRLSVALWTLVLLRLVIPPGLSSPWSLRRLVEWSGSRLVGETAGILDEKAGAVVLAGSASDPNPQTRGAGVENVVLAALWLAGALALAALLAGRSRSYRRLVRGGRRVQHPEVLAVVERWRRLLGVRRPVDLVTADAAVSPFTTGIRRPVIFLPGAIARLASRDVLEAVVAHEMAHVRRRDCLGIHLQNLLQVIYFFHPAVWLASRELNRARESACDALVLSRGAMSRRRYGKSLLFVLRMQLARAPGMPTLGNQGRSLVMRMQDIVGPGSSSTSSTSSRPRPWLARSIALLCGSFLLPMAPSGAGADPAPPVERRAADDPIGLPVTLADPLRGARLTSAFGARANPFSGEPETHTGVDLAAPAGTELRAPATGVVEVATDRLAGKEHMGLVLVIDHGLGVKTSYSHLGILLVESGERVEPAQEIARVGLSGKSTGPHVHFEVLLDGKPVDPERAVRRW